MSFSSSSSPSPTLSSPRTSSSDDEKPQNRPTTRQPPSLTRIPSLPLASLRKLRSRQLKKNSIEKNVDVESDNPLSKSDRVHNLDKRCHPMRLGALPRHNKPYESDSAAQIALLSPRYHRRLGHTASESSIVRIRRSHSIISAKRGHRQKQLFRILAEGKSYVKRKHFISTVSEKGCHPKLLHRVRERLPEYLQPDQFYRMCDQLPQAVKQILFGNPTVPDWDIFSDTIRSIYKEVASNTAGQNASYIPQLSKVDPSKFGVSVCSATGQFCSVGDVKDTFSIQSVSMVISYCIALEQHGEEKLSRYVGHEPSGKSYDAMVLNKNNQPHNPLINTGGIMCASLIDTQEKQSTRFDNYRNIVSQLANARVGFDNATYLSELEFASTNYALAYYLHSRGPFSEISTPGEIQKHLQFYFQLCSITTNTNDLAVIAGVLANGGVHPYTGKRIFAQRTVRNCLSLMFSCGMYDYSGEFSYSVGIPAKTGVSGVIMAVVPGKLGFAVWSPRLNDKRNSVRGVNFFQRLTNCFSLHAFDKLPGISTTKLSPFNRCPYDAEQSQIGQFLFAACNGDLAELRQIYANMIEKNSQFIDTVDYDKRSALHLAASENRLSIARQLLSWGANPFLADIRGNTPLDDAYREEADPGIIQLLQTAQQNFVDHTPKPQTPMRNTVASGSSSFESVGDSRECDGLAAVGLSPSLSGGLSYQEQNALLLQQRKIINSLQTLVYANHASKGIPPASLVSATSNSSSVSDPHLNTDNTICQLCHVSVDPRHWATHRKSPTHQQAEIHALLQSSNFQKKVIKRAVQMMPSSAADTSESPRSSDSDEPSHQTSFNVKFHASRESTTIEKAVSDGDSPRTHKSAHHNGSYEFEKGQDSLFENDEPLTSDLSSSEREFLMGSK